ncbi:MAG: hypothetical protein PHO08_20845 [Methylococcales bacterium]|nr:hypothetical protein [Methylococcales bacterium]MDD5633178.1 hypothetical protein [Methylococcales bacterium]
MKISDKFNGVNDQEQTQFGISHSIRTGLAMLVLPMIIIACAVTDSKFLAQNAPSAQNTALTRGRFELNCPQASGSVLSQKVSYINGKGIGSEGYEWAEYKIGVRGCGKNVIYETICRDQDNCSAFVENGMIIQDQ